jgi:hypothetical protein
VALKAVAILSAAESTRDAVMGCVVNTDVVRMWKHLVVTYHRRICLESLRKPREALVRLADTWGRDMKPVSLEHSAVVIYIYTYIYIYIYIYTHIRGKVVNK